MPGVLARTVDDLIARLTPALVGLARASGVAEPDEVAGNVALEAFNLAAAYIDADGLHTDEELWEFVSVFGPRFDTVARAASPAALRTAGLLSGKRTFLESPSDLFRLMVHADARDQTSNSWDYYEAALAIGRAVCSLDNYPSHAELSALERFRSILLTTMDATGLSRPGHPNSPMGSTAAIHAEVETERPVSSARPPRPLEELLAELDDLVGLAAVKAEVKLVTNLLRIEKLREERSLPVVETTRHLVFTGNPGTGKTTVARLLAQIYRTLGVVTKGHLVETDRSGLVAGYVGQTATKVKEVFDSAQGGILLIDEAYSLARGGENDFGREAIDMIVKLMEDHRDDTVLIVAGYPDEMATFIDANPGLRSRFPKTIFFDDYSSEELVLIFASMCERSHYRTTPEALEQVLAFVVAQPRDRGFGNARLVRNLFEEAVARQASRVVDLKPVTDELLVTLEAADIPSP